MQKFSLNLNGYVLISCSSAAFTGESPTASESGVPGELFSLLAECETEKQPGRELLTRAKLLRWPLLAVVASCHAEVTSLSCLTTWLELTAARSGFKCKFHRFISSTLSSTSLSLAFLCSRGLSYWSFDAHPNLHYGELG